jgi:hypothetical protein
MEVAMSAELMFLVVVLALMLLGAVGVWIYSAVTTLRAKRRQEALPRRAAVRPMPSKFDSRRYR